jgi:hypothetical protein
MAPDCKSGEVTSTQVRILLCPYLQTWMNEQKRRKEISLLCGCSSIGRASAFQADCYGFNSRHPLSRRKECSMKRCPRCGETRPPSEFGLRRSGGNKRQLRSYCRLCYKHIYWEHYEKHKALFIQRADRFHLGIRGLVRAAKAKPCADCGKSYPYYVMEFDHREGEKKSFNIAAVMGPHRVGKTRLLEEIAKCDVVCANCHRERTYQRKQYWPKKYRNKTKIQELSPHLLP